MKTENSIEIAATPKKSWSFIIEPEKVLKWSPFSKFEYTSEQRSGVGTTIHVEEKVPIPMPSLKVDFTITEWIENEKIASEMTSGPGFLNEVEQKWLIEAIPSGSRVTYIENAEFSRSIIGKLFGFLSQLTADKDTRKMLLKLKSLVEA